MHAIQAVRFLAALLVVGYHANIFADQHIARAADSVSMVLASIGRSGVHIFFVISGFIMMFTIRPSMYLVLPSGSSGFD